MRFGTSHDAYLTTGQHRVLTFGDVIDQTQNDWMFMSRVRIIECVKGLKMKNTEGYDYLNQGHAIRKLLN